MADAFPYSSVVIVGCGLIGASLGLAIRERYPQVRLVGADLPEVISTEAVRRVTSQLVNAADPDALVRAYRSAECTVLAAPVGVIKGHLKVALSNAPCVTDCGSTKREVLLRARQCSDQGRFVAGHPMAGHPVGGAASADPALFDGHRWILCPEAGSVENLTKVKRLVSCVGARPVLLDAAAHDAAVALTSHVPQLLASLLAVLGQEEGALGASGPGFASATRVAGGQTAMWRDIYATNADEVGRVARVLGERLIELGDALARGDVSQAVSVLERARASRSG